MKLRAGGVEVEIEVDEVDRVLNLSVVYDTLHTLLPAIVSAALTSRGHPPVPPRANEAILAEWRELSAKFKSEGITLMLSEMTPDEVSRTVRLAMELGILGQ